MYVTLNLDQFDINNIFTSEKTKNNIMNHSDFYRLYFSNDEMVMNGIYLNFDLKNVTIEKYFNKIKCCYDESCYNSEIINKIVNIEKGIVDKSEDINSKSCYRIDEQLSHKYIKIFDQNKLKLGHHKNLSILLKISGIWSSNKTQQYGLTFRFFINY